MESFAHATAGTTRCVSDRSSPLHLSQATKTKRLCFMSNVCSMYLYIYTYTHTYVYMFYIFIYMFVYIYLSICIYIYKTKWLTLFYIKVTFVHSSFESKVTNKFFNWYYQDAVYLSVDIFSSLCDACCLGRMHCVIM